MTEAKSAFREAKEELTLLRWVFGWHPVVGWAMIVFLVSGIGYYFGRAYQFALAGVILGGPIWYLSMRYINANWEPLRTGYLEDVEQFGPLVMKEAGMDPGASMHLLTKSPDKRQPFVEAPTQVDATLIGLDDAGLWIYDQTTLDLMFQKGKVEMDPEEVIEFPYSNLEAVTFEDDVLTITPVEETEEQREYKTPLDAEPTELLAAVSDRTDGQ